LTTGSELTGASRDTIDSFFTDTAGGSCYVLGLSNVLRAVFRAAADSPQ